MRRAPGLATRLLLAHLLVIAAATGTLLLVTWLTAHTLHERLMLAMLGPDATWSMDPMMLAMERATDAVFQTAMLQALLLSGAAATVVAILMSIWLSRRIVEPLHQVLAASERLAAGQYHERLTPRGSAELARLAAQFNAMAAALEGAERRRMALIGDVAHELRTPLATITGYAEGVLDGVVLADDATWALVHDEARRLGRLVDDLQQLSHAEAAELALHRGRHAVAALVDAAVARLAARLAAHEVRLVWQPPAEPLEVLVDADRIIQVIVNLLDDAMRHTPAGGTVWISVGHDRAGVAVEVRDSGVGIAAEHLPHVFERFYRSDPARARATGGAGIGLTICRALVQAHGGTISASSAGAGQGTSVRFSLPRADAP